MHIKPYTCMHEVLSFSRFDRRHWQSFAVQACSVPHLPARFGRHKIPAVGLRSRKMPSQTEEKRTIHLAVEECGTKFSHSTSYENAMEALSSLITRQSRADKSAIGGKYEKLERMAMYLKILGLEEQIAGLRIIHVAGTKGKGSTCAFCEAILRECGLRTGLFTSPHLIDVRERFRIDGLDISEDKFLQHFWDCWEQLRVDVGIIEVGLGGTRDSTNVIKEPVVCGIASLGMDHLESLGDTLAEIANHKAGIFKPNVPAFTVPQLPEAMVVLEERAHQLMVPLEVVSPLNCGKLNGHRLSLAGDHQFVNAGLAVSLSKCWLQCTGAWEKLFPNDGHEVDLPDEFLRGLSSARLSGRAQIVSDRVMKSDGVSSGDLIFYLDGAHTPESMDVCAKWFSAAVVENCHSTLSSSSSSLLVDGCMNIPQQNGCIHHEKGDIVESIKLPKRILLFNCMEVRDPQILLPQLVGTCAFSGIYFSKALFVPSMSTYSKVTSGTSTSISPRRDLSWQFSMQRIWEKMIHGKDFDADKAMMTNTVETLPLHRFIYEDNGHCHPGDGYHSCSVVIPSLPLAIKWLRDCVKDNPCFKVQVLVTGSMHLVGDVLKLLRR
ncbi:Folylpolyglutamate synthase [Ancistrocladus abbreviatus]